MKPSPLVTAAIGVVTGVICIGAAMLAHHIGFPLSELQREALMGGGLMALLGGVAGARFMPTKGDGQ
jgi:hypothetical protein